MDLEKFIWDAIVIGSGASGGRIAKNLTDKGAKVLLLEAGRHYSAKDFPKSEFDASLQLYWSGGAELNHDAKLGFLRGKGVGGTTLVNQALLDRFDDFVWDEWKDRSGVDFKDLEIEKMYDEVEASLSIQTIEKQNFGMNTQKFIQAFDKKSFRWSPLRRAQGDCGLEKGSDCMACLGGCPRNSKQSSLVVSVEPALKTGLTLLPNCEVQVLKPTDNQVEILAAVNQKSLKLRARVAVLAAGSFGSTEILLRSDLPNMSDALGKNISCHPQYMVFSLFDEEINAHKGAFQGVKSADASLRQMGIKFENVFAPPIATAMLFQGLGRQHQAMMLKYKHLASMEVAIRDEPTGKMFLDRKGVRHVEKTLTTQDQSRRKKGLEFIQDMYSNIGAKDLIVAEQGFGLHLMGGCRMGLAESNSVVSPEFHLHGNKNIYCADSSIFPSSSGINPSLTVKAFSQAASLKIAKRLGE